MKVIVEFLESGRFRDNFWDGEFHVDKGEHRAVSPSLAAQLINNHAAALYRTEDVESDMNSAIGQTPLK